MEDDNTDILASFWVEAVEAYERECEHPIELSSPDTSLHNSDDLLRLIESRGDDFKAFRSKHGKLWSRMKRFVEPITTAGNLTADFLGDSTSAGVPVAGILKAITHLVSACRDVTNAYDWIETVFDELQNFSDRLNSHVKTTITSAMRRTIVAILAFILRIIGRSELLVKRGRVREYFRTAFIGKDQKTLDLLEDLNKIITNEGRLTLALTHEKTEKARNLAARGVELGLETNQKLDDIHESVQGMKYLFQENTRASDQAQAHHIDQFLLQNLHHTLETISVTDTDDWYSLFKWRLLDGSGSWLQKELLFDTWLQGHAPILWVFGGPGSGKTMLSTWLITTLSKQVEAGSNVGAGTSIGYFFIKENVENLRNPNIMFKTMAWQIQQTDSSFRQHAAAVCEFSRNTIRAEDTWGNLFLGFYQKSLVEGRRAILVIDGLDEAEVDTRRRILHILKQYVTCIQPGLPARIQFAIFGRSELRLELEAFKLGHEKNVIEVSTAKNHEDMEKYITARLKNLQIIRVMRRRKPDGDKEAKKFARNVRQKVLDGAGGVFLWAQLLVDQMEGKDDRNINAILVNPPSNLYDMIYLVFDRLSKDREIDISTANKLLSWVAFARRPLQFGELDVFLRPTSDSTNWFLWDHVRGKFASVLQLRYPKGNYPVSKEDEMVTDKSENMLELEAKDGRPSEYVNDEDDNFSLDDSSDSDSDTPTSTNHEKVVGEERNDGTQSDLRNEVPEISDADRHYSWHQKHTIVDFSHQRFRDFLILEDDEKTRQHPALPIRIDVKNVEVELVLDCFKNLRASPNNGSINYYISYAAFHVFSHLAEIEEEKLDEDTRIQNLQELFWLMHEERGGRVIFASIADYENEEVGIFWQLWLANNRTTSLLQRWFARGAQLNHFEQSEKLWMREAATSVKVLLKPLAMTAANIWLTMKSYADNAYLRRPGLAVWFLKGYRALDDQGEIPEELFNDIYAKDMRAFYKMSAAEIEDLAEWAGFEKTTHWYTRVGWILYVASHRTRALELLAKAIEMDETAWAAMDATARCLGDEGDYDTAISMMERALKIAREFFEDGVIDWHLIMEISRWRQYLGDHSGALESAAEAWTKTPYNYQAVDNYVRNLANRSEWERLIYVLKCLYDSDNGYGASRLVKYFDYNFPSDIGRASRARGHPSFIIEAFKQALQQMEKSGDELRLISRMLALGDLYHDFYDQDDEAIRWWNDALLRINTANFFMLQEASSEVKVIYTNKIAQIHFHAAVRNFEAQVYPNEALTELRRLASLTDFKPEDNEDVFAFYTPGYPSLLYGRWLRDYEKAEAAVWRKCFRARILEQIKGLDDNDPTNDTSACTKLAMSLFQADDEKRAGAIVAVLFKTLEDYLHKQESHQTEASQTREPGETSLDSVSREEQAQFQRSDNTKADPKDSYNGSSSTATPGAKEALKRQAVEASDLVLQLKGDSWVYSCDVCDHSFRAKGIFWFCEICYDVALCGECLEKVKSSSAEKRVCNPCHKWYRVWPLQKGKVKEMASAYEEGGRVRLRKEWLESLRNEWLRS